MGEKHGNEYQHQHCCPICKEPFVIRWRNDVAISSEQLHKDNCKFNPKNK